MLQSACIHKMQTQIEPPVNRQKPDILGNQPQTPFSHSLPSEYYNVCLAIWKLYREKLTFKEVTEI